MNKAIFLLLGITFLLISFSSSKAQQKHAFSSEKMLVDDQVFLPYYKGKIEKNVEGSYAPFFEKVIAIVQQDPNFRMPQGVKIIFSAYEQTLEIWVNPYTIDEGAILAYFGAYLSITLNQPGSMVGNSICTNFYNQPMETGSFHGNKIYDNGKREVFVLTHFSGSPFVPAGRKEFIENLIANEEKKEAENPTPRNNELLAQMNEAYQQLLQIDKVAAADYLKEMENMKKNLAGFDASLKVSEQIKAELDCMPVDEKTQQAYYAVGAYERYGKISGLLPVGKEQYGDPLIKINPAIQSACNSETVRLITLEWNFMNIKSVDDFTGDSLGNNLANQILISLYRNNTIWEQILGLVN